MNNVNSLPSNGHTVKKRDGRDVPFKKSIIRTAIYNCLLDVEGLKNNNPHNSPVSNRLHEEADKITESVMRSIFRKNPNTNIPIFIEDIQDQVELAFMRDSNQQAARSYVIYREERRSEREAKQLMSIDTKPIKEAKILVIDALGNSNPLNKEWLKTLLFEATEGLDGIDVSNLMDQTINGIYDGIEANQINNVLILTARNYIDKHPNYSIVTARLLLDTLRKDSLSFTTQKSVSTQKEMSDAYSDYFKSYLQKGIDLELIDPELATYDLDVIANAIKPNQDMDFTYLGLQTLYDRYFLHSDDLRFEMPQAFFMRVAMGLAINESDREAKTIAFYELLSSFDFMSSTPTLFNSGTLRPQLSSCYLTTVPDDLKGIFESITDNAMLSKFAGGLGNDWTNVRGLDSKIKGTNGKSSGVIPFLKVCNDTALAVDQGGKRKGAVCAYLETWHIDIQSFLELRKNVGDDRRRTHDMNTANWIPDLFMKRVAEESEWTLFSPDEVPDLHDLVGQKFETAYLRYEEMARNGNIKVTKSVKALDLWKEMIGMLFETGHPWMTFKDPCNIRYSNQHEGVVHSSNLCTEIMLHTNDDEIAVCNLGSINLAAHIINGELDLTKLESTIKTAVRMLDNVIDYNFYNSEKARYSNLKHRPIGLGLMGFQDALYQLRIPYSSDQAIEFADKSMEVISYFAIKASTDLAEEKGSYSTFKGSLWSQGILPIDSLKLLKKQRGEQYLRVDEKSTLDWSSLRERVVSTGMRNSNVMAIAPTATISNVCGITQSIEPTYQNLFVKSNLSGEFTIVNKHLVNDLIELGLWDDVMIADLRYYDGSVTPIDRIPEDLKALYATAFEMDSRWLIEAASRRQKWIDQGQSLNLYAAQSDGTMLSNMYQLAWLRGLKTTYYLRSLGATTVAKNQVDTIKQNSSLNSHSTIVSIQHAKPEIKITCEGGCE